jgi:hypothetical protein
VKLGGIVCVGIKVDVDVGRLVGINTTVVPNAGVT